MLFRSNKTSNPYTINLSANQSQIVDFWINATGELNTTHEFFAYANRSTEPLQSDSTTNLNITIHNYPPIAQNVNISTELGKTNQFVNLTGTFTYYDQDGHTQQANETKWYNNSVEVTSLRNATEVGSGNTTIGENWTFSVRVYDGYEWSEWNNKTITIQSTEPTIELLTPLNDTTLTQYSNRTPMFTWNGTDLDGDSLNYTIWISEDISFSTINKTTNTTNEHYLINTELEVDKTYFWKVQANDGTTKVNSTTFNFTIESYKAISLIINTIDFGQLNRGTTAETENNATPIIIENIGNININLSIYANNSLWNNNPLNTNNYMFKADTNESNSFNEGTSTMSWMNMTNSSYNLLKELDYHQASDAAELDINITIPMDESPGEKSSEIIIEG